MATRPIQLRWHGRCCECRAELGVAETALFDDRSHQLTCTSCAAGTPRSCAPSAPTASIAAPVARRRENDLTDAKAQVRGLIADARAALDASRRAG